MDGSHFDTLAKTLAAAGSRRQALGGLLVASLALLSRAQTEDAAAHNAKKKCQKKSGDAKKKCLKKAKKHNRQHATQTPTAITLPPDASFVDQAPPPPPEEIPATCNDGVQNGSETDIDCGGPDCLRCTTGAACGGQADCTSALCINTVCTACSATNSCGSDSNGSCNCSKGACTTNTSSTTVAICTDCPPYWFCYDLGGQHWCFAPCGSA